MHFALLGDHPDGIDAAHALVATGRHALSLYCGPVPGIIRLQRMGLEPQRAADVEEVLADSEIELVVVASAINERAAHLRRALQSELHVLCVHPADPSPDIAYEAALIQSDTQRVLLPLLPMSVHPALRRFAELARDWQPMPVAVSEKPLPSTSLSARMLELEVWSTEEILLEGDRDGSKPCVPAWDALRLVGGEIVEIYVQSAASALVRGQPLIVSGRFQSGLLLQARYVPNQAEGRWSLSLVTPGGRATLSFAQGWPGHAQLTFTDEAGQQQTEKWESADPWLTFVAHFESLLARPREKQAAPGKVDDACLTSIPAALGWQDELRALELDDAARRSAESGRSSTLDVQEVTEETSFKGTMTLVGCTLIWVTVAVLIASLWVPWLAWVLVPLLTIFLLLQALRWVLPGDTSKPRAPARPTK